MTTITKLPPVPSPDDPDNFDDEADAFVAALPQLVTEMNQSNAESAGYAKSASDSATVAAQCVTDAGKAKTGAETARSEAEGFKNQARDYSFSAYDNAVLAQNAADSLTATSATSHTIGNGTKTFITQAGKKFIGQRLRLVNPLNSAQWMYGNVSSYSGTTLNITIDDVNASAAGIVVANWLIGLGGEKGAAGPQGGITGGSLTGALNERQANNILAAEEIDPWSGPGNYMGLSGSGTIKGFANAPQLGAKRTLAVGGSPTIEASSRVLVYGGTQTLSPGDLIEVRCVDALDYFRVTIHKRDGSAVVGGRQYILVLTSGSTWTVDATSFEVEVQAGGQGGHRGFNGSFASGEAGWCGVKRFVGATVGATAVISIGSAGAAGTAFAAPLQGGTTSFSLAGFTTLTATFTGVTGADLAHAPRPAGNAYDLTFGSESTRVFGQGGDSRNGFGGAGGRGTAFHAVGYGAGGRGAESGNAGNGSGGCIIIRYFK